MAERQFPKNFYWGAATSAHQVEGDNHNDWTEWEARRAKFKVTSAKLKKWPDYILNNYPNPLQEENYISGRACDHYNRFREDFDIAKFLGHNAHRFSIEWSRIEPEEGKFNEKEIEHYREVIRALRERGMEPFVTLWHYTVPLWFRDKGGWVNKKSVDRFARYVRRIVGSLPEVNLWITLNEVNIYTGYGYWSGVEPPGRSSLVSYFFANYHFWQAHRAAYRIIKEIKKEAKVGIAHSVTFFAKNPIKSFFWNHLFLRSLGGLHDFIGVNYYKSDRPSSFHTDLGWGIDPEGFYMVLKEMSRYQKPIYVTENGIADACDSMRTKFIKDHIEAMKKAMAEGVDVRGYFYWSLLDNFEMPRLDGFWPRFGLVEIDYKTQERKIRPSAWEYKKMIEEHRYG